ncbi:sugar-binding transcriptional regulator, LacI family [gut metagenome]|uniref:Sugar-binding transcriptional regulator, LacI family n=1 Tax=gut metagenome TaxID=749906 RepID=J9GNR4_9ZZZZ
MENKNYTIKEIARMAGVSAGTVDRVLHHRPDVSEKTRQKVQNVLDEINYQPNVFAIGLAAKKPYRILCLIPAHTAEDYWSAVERGIERAAAELRPFNVGVESIYYHHADVKSYQESCSQLLEECPDGILIAPNFQDETLKLAIELDARSIPYAFIDVNVEQAHALCYIGQNSQMSGYIAAKLLMNRCQPGEELVLFLSSQLQHSHEIQMQRRFSGFQQYLSEHSISVQVHEVVLQKNDIAANSALLEDFFAAHPQAVLGVGFNSRIYQVASYLQTAGHRLKGLVGYDLLPSNVSFLQSGEVDWLIGQRPALQGYCGVKSITDYVVFKKPVVPVQYMPIDILMKENVEYQWMLDN